MTEPLEQHLLGQAAAEPVGFWHRVRAMAVIERLGEDRPQGVLDIGAGAGSLGRVLAEVRPDATYRFHERYDSVATVLEQRHGDGSRLHELSNLAEITDITVIAALDVIEHVDDDVAFLGQIVERSEPGVRLVITVPALPRLWSSWDEQLGHRRRYRRADLAEVASRLPLEVEEISYLFPELLPAALFRRWIRKPGTVAEAEFPEFRPIIDRLLLAVSRATYRLRRLWPAGTSLLLAARVITEDP